MLRAHRYIIILYRMVQSDGSQHIEGRGGGKLIPSDMEMVARMQPKHCPVGRNNMAENLKSTKELNYVYSRVYNTRSEFVVDIYPGE